MHVDVVAPVTSRHQGELPRQYLWGLNQGSVLISGNALNLRPSVGVITPAAAADHTDEPQGGIGAACNQPTLPAA